jgi:hypothetical protein
MIKGSQDSYTLPLKRGITASCYQRIMWLCYHSTLGCLD